MSVWSSPVLNLQSIHFRKESTTAQIRLRFGKYLQVFEDKFALAAVGKSIDPEIAARLTGQFVGANDICCPDNQGVRKALISWSELDANSQTFIHFNDIVFFSFWLLKHLFVSNFACHALGFVRRGESSSTPDFLRRFDGLLGRKDNKNFFSRSWQHASCLTMRVAVCDFENELRLAELAANQDVDNPSVFSKFRILWTCALEQYR